MDIDEIMKRFAMMAELSDEAANRWKPLCSDALADIRTQCRDDVDLAEQSSVLCAAVSALAYYRYTLCVGVGELGDFTAGDVKISNRGSSIDCAKALWQQAKERIAPLLRDEGFFFGTIGGDGCETQ